MKVVKEGYTYEVSNFDNKESSQTIQFIQKETPPNAELGTLVTVKDGTTNEEVLEVVIHRLKTLNKKIPSRQTSLAITKLEEALMWLENRTKERKNRGVEGKHLK